MKKYVTVVECAIEHDNKFLIIKRPAGVYAAGLLAFPGGKVDENDEANGFNILVQAAKREVFEEVGLALQDPIRYVTSCYFEDTRGNHVIDTIFHCKLVKTDPNVIASEREVAEYYWLTHDEINDAENSSEWLKAYMDQVVRTARD